jgi:ABC-type antimicrobial peptide transport system permease subunit
MGVGISAILFLVSLGYGLQNTILERITTSDSLLTLDVIPDHASPIILDAPTIEKIKGIDGVTEVSPNFQLSAQGTLDDLKTEIPVTAVNQSYFRLSGIKLSQGKLFSDDEKEGILISSSVAQIFSKTTDEMMGKEMTFVFSVPDNGANTGSGEQQFKKIASEQKFKIIGVIESEGNAIYFNYASLDNLGLTYFDQLKVRCQSNAKMALVRTQIQDMGFSVSSISETVDQANKVFNVIKIVLMLFGVIALVVSAIGMFNTMTITLLERTEEIGIMKSIGASDMTISLMFIMEATIMGFLGGLMGILIGWSEGMIFNTVVNLIATRFGGQKVSLFYSPWWFIMTIIGFAAVVGFITGVIPARRAARTDPLEALRYK